MAARLAGKVAVVTGGGSGIGAAVARLLAREGCHVVVAGRREDLVRAVADEVGGMAFAADVTVDAEVAGLFDACDGRFGRLDVLVNNAGYGGGGLIAAEEMDFAAWDRTFAVNVRGPMFCIARAIPLLRRQGGTIVNVASIAGLKPNRLQIPYGASKAALVNLTKSVADEVGAYGIRVNAICPGAVDTDLYRGNAGRRVAATAGTIDDDKRRIASSAALDRLTAAEEVASGVLFLASAASGSMTGTHMVMDAGKF
ncbi:MAG: SDR family oxidoreductase [Alphaproteobacteria bacterium]|nr:SDR family oxidoreductase [Alphaproteobacteria bacterium]